MPATFSQQLRYLRRNEPSLYEAISKEYRKCLMESNLAPQMNQTDAEAAETPIEKTEIKQNNTKGVDDLMSKVHAMVGVNESKKEGEEIFDLKKDDIETVRPDPQQQAELLGEEPPVELAASELVPETPPEAPVSNEVAPAAPADDVPVEDPGEFDLDNFFSDSTDDTAAQPLGESETETPPEEPSESTENNSVPV